MLTRSEVDFCTIIQVVFVFLWRRLELICKIDASGLWHFSLFVRCLPSKDHAHRAKNIPKKGTKMFEIRIFGFMVELKFGQKDHLWKIFIKSPLISYWITYFFPILQAMWDKVFMKSSFRFFLYFLLSLCHLKVGRLLL